MANDQPSLMQFLAESQRGLNQSVYGPQFLQKAEYFTVDTSTNIFNTTYGRKVWHALNNQTRFFNALPRVVWGQTAGWRIRTDRGSQRSTPVTETGNLPVVDVSDIQVVSSLPRTIATTFGASVKSAFVAQLEGGVGDVLALENENAQLDHIKELQEQLLSSSAMIASGGTSVTTIQATTPAYAGNFHVGDSVAHNDATDDSQNDQTGLAVSAVNTTDGTVTHAATTMTGPTVANGDVMYAVGRGGLTSIDDIVSIDGTVFAARTGGIETNVYSGITVSDRTSGNWNAAGSVQHNNGVGRDLSLSLIDTAIQNIRQKGGDPKLIVMNHDQYFRMERLLASQQRYNGQEDYQVGVGNERTFPGTRTGLVLATYQGIPILPDADVPGSMTAADAELGSNIYVLDTDFLEIAVAQPTQYMENRDYFAANALVVRGLLYTMGELRCKNFITQAKITDLNA